jgi:hypothetical protein
MIKNDKKNEIKIANNEAHITIIYLCIPVILQVRVAVCHGVPKSTTVPVPVIPVLEALWVYLYLCETLTLLDNENVILGVRKYLAAQALGSIMTKAFCQQINKVVVPALGFM